jgi:hypothetical protein
MHAYSLDPGRSCFSAFSATCILRNPDHIRGYPRTILAGGGIEGRRQELNAR